MNPFATSSPPPVFGTEAAASYSPPNTGAWAPVHDDLEDDEPFTAAHLAAANEAAVPSVSAAASASRPASSPPHTTLNFTDSTAALPSSQALTGKVGQPASPVPRIGSAPDTRLLNSSPAPGSTSLDMGGPSGSAAGGTAGQPTDDPSKFAFYNIKRYRGLFNVDTGDVLTRLMHAVLLFFRGDFLEFTDGNPDLYGPFWIASTLIFVTAACGNLASYINYTQQHPGESHGGWYYDVDKVGASFGIFYGYLGIVGLALWAVLRWYKAGVSLASVWCTYGYALAAFIPICILCVIPVDLARWIVVGVATLTSGTCIMLSLRRPIHESLGAKALPVYCTMIALHAGLGLALRVYFFSFAKV